VLGFIFSFEALLALNGVKSAKKWIRRWNTPKQFKRKLIIFLPFLHTGYFLLEIVPYYMGIDKDIKPFDLEKIYRFIYGHL